MHYEIDYTNKTNAAEDAEQDCIYWLGKEQFDKLVAILQADEGRTNENLVRLGLSLQGIQGFPAEVLMNKYWK